MLHNTGNIFKVVFVILHLADRKSFIITVSYTLRIR